MDQLLYSFLIIFPQYICIYESIFIKSSIYIYIKYMYIYMSISKHIYRVGYTYLLNN